MFTMLEFYVGLLVGAVFATLVLLAGGIDTAVAAVGVPAVVGLTGTVLLGIRRAKARRTPGEALA